MIISSNTDSGLFMKILYSGKRICLYAHSYGTMKEEYSISLFIHKNINKNHIETQYNPVQICVQFI